MWSAFQPAPPGRGWADVAATKTDTDDRGIHAGLARDASTDTFSAPPTTAPPRYQQQHVHQQPTQAQHLQSLLQGLPPAGLTQTRSAATGGNPHEKPGSQAFLPPPSSAAVRLPTAVVLDGDAEKTSFRRWKWDAATLTALPTASSGVSGKGGGRARGGSGGTGPTTGTGRRRDVSAAAMDALETETMLLATMPRLADAKPSAVAAAAAFRALAPFLSPEDRAVLQVVFSTKAPADCLAAVVDVADRANRTHASAGFGFAGGVTGASAQFSGSGGNRANTGGGAGYVPYSASPGSFAAVAGGAPGAVVRPGKNHGHLMAAGGRGGVGVATTALDGLALGGDGPGTGVKSPSASPVGSRSPVNASASLGGDASHGAAAMFGTSLFSVGDSVRSGAGNFDFAPAAIGAGDDGNSSGGGGSIGGRSSSSGMGSHRGSGSSLWGGQLPAASSASAWASIVASGGESTATAPQANGSQNGSPSDTVQWSSAIERGAGMPRLDVNAPEYRPNFRTQ